MTKQLTISVAAYNVEDYLDQLMDSVIKADVMDELEILIINDGSKDRTVEIARGYQDQYPQSVRLIDKPNGGHGSTINKGIEEATGRYFRALDGDDWIHSEHLAALVKKMGSIDSDVILSDYCECYEDGRTRLPNEFPELKDGGLYQFEKIWHPKFWMRYHTVIFRTELLKKHQIRLDEHCFYVDVELMLYPIPYLNSIFFSKDYLYCYRIGYDGQSVSDLSRKKNIKHSEKVAYHLIDYFETHKESLSENKRQYFIDELTFHCKWYIDSLFLFPCGKEIKNDLVAFEQYILAHAPEIYKQMGEESTVITLLRKSAYSAYRLLAQYKKYRIAHLQKGRE